MSGIDCTIPLKRCTKCGVEYPATPEYFRCKRNKKDGLEYRCKTCAKQDYQDSGSEYQRQWRERHPEYHAQYFKKNQETISRRTRITSKAWRLSNPEQVRDYYKKNLIASRAKTHLRKARKRGLVSTFTRSQWHACLEYFHHTCAYCGAQQDFWHVLEQDHYMPLSAGGGYTADNIIPACKSCNSSKGDSPVNEWLNRVHGKRKAKDIITRITEYFEWCKEQN